MVIRDSIHQLKVAHRIEIKIAPLDHVHPVSGQKAKQGTPLFRCVGEARTVQVIDGHMNTARQGRIDTGHHIVKTIAFGTEISVVTVRADTVHTNAQAVQPGIYQLDDLCGQAAVGVHVNGSIAGGPTNGTDGFDNGIRGHQRVPFAPLAEADHGLFHATNMRHGHLGDFIRCGGKRDAVLAVVNFSGRLQGDTPQTARIAGGCRGQGCLETPQEKILACRTAIGQGAFFQMGTQAVVGQAAPHVPHASHNFLLRHAAQVLTGLAVHLDQRRSEFSPMPSDGPV